MINYNAATYNIKIAIKSDKVVIYICHYIGIENTQYRA